MKFLSLLVLAFFSHKIYAQDLAGKLSDYIMNADFTNVELMLNKNPELLNARHEEVTMLARATCMAATSNQREEEISQNEINILQMLIDQG